MPDNIFYVGSTDRRYPRGNIINGYVPSKFLVINGRPVVDPVPGGSQNANIYADDQGILQKNGIDANPDNYLIVPTGFSEQRARDYANRISDIQKPGVLGLLKAWRTMGSDFYPDGPEDLQRGRQWGIPENGFVRAYTSAASHYLGFVGGLTNTPLDLVEWAGGHTNGGPDKKGPQGVSRKNHANLVKGYADATAPPDAEWRTNDFGYGSQGQIPDGQIGDGRGVASWISSLYGVDPSDPTQPVAQRQTSGPLGLVSNQPMPQWPVPPPIFNTR